MVWQYEKYGAKIQGGFKIETILQKSIVDIENVDFSYNGDLILENVNMAVRKYDFIAVIGPNGGGKTTLLKLMLGLENPDRGVVTVLGESPEKKSSYIGYVPQNVNINENFPITALDVVLMGTIERGKSRRIKKTHIRETALSILDRFQMADCSQKKIGELSGGQRQRVFIARSLMTNPELLLLDEPTASIDTKGQADFYKLLEELNKEIAIAVVTHDLFAISNYVKSIACVNKGLHYHTQEEISGSMLEKMYACSVEDVCRVQVLTQGLSGTSSGKHNERDDGNS